MATSTRVSIEVSHPGDWSVSPPLEHRAERRVAEIVADLKLPLVPVLTFEAIPEDEVAEPAWRVAIDGRVCRQELAPGPQYLERGAEDLSNLLSAVVHANRSLLLTPTLLREVANRYGVRVAALLPHMIERGVSLEVATEVAKHAEAPRGRDVRYEIELALSRTDPRTTTIELGPELYARFSQSTADGGRGAEMLGLLRDGLFYSLGVKLPRFRLAYAPELDDFEFRVALRSFRGPVGRTLAPDEFLVNRVPEGLPRDVMGRPATNPADGERASIVSGNAAAAACEADGCTAWDYAGYLTLLVSRFARHHARELFSIVDAHQALGKLSEAFPLPIVDLLESFPPVHVLDVLRLLLEEQISIRDLRSIMEAMMEVKGRLPGQHEDRVIVAPPIARLVRGGREAGAITAEERADYVRRRMARHVTSNAMSAGAFHVVETSPDTEARLRAVPVERDPKLQRAVARAVAAACGQLVRIVVTSSDVRRSLRRAIAIELPDVSVLARDELTGRTSTHESVHLE